MKLIQTDVMPKSGKFIVLSGEIMFTQALAYVGTYWWCDGEIWIQKTPNELVPTDDGILDYFKKINAVFVTGIEE